MSESKTIHILRAGTHTDSKGQDVTFTEADLVAMAEAYAKRKTLAPVVIGHPKHDDPAFGWVTALRAEGQNLFAKVDQLVHEFAERVRGGRYRHVSAALYGPTHKANPTPGSWGLRHLGFLGAMPPAVKELEPVELSEDEDYHEFATDAPEAPTVDQQTEKIMADQPINKPAAPVEEDRAAEFAERETQLSERERQLQEREDRLAQQEAERMRAAHLAFAEHLSAEGRILPRHQATLVEVLAALEGAEVAFAEGEDEVPLVDTLKDFLKQLPKQVEFGEVATATNDDGDQEEIAEFAAPDGYSVDAGRLKLHNKVLAYSKAHNVSYAEAARAVRT